MNIQAASSLNQRAENKPWYKHRWPWLLMLGPLVVVLAGIHTTWLAFSNQDALVVDDYYKQGKAINMDLRRDRVASSMKLNVQLRYDAASGKLLGSINNVRKQELINISLIHSTQPEKDLRLAVYPDEEGNFSADLSMLDIARWQILVENERRDWRLNGNWGWPNQRQIELKAD
jgi:hypothetical protein